VSLADASSKRDGARVLLAAGADPGRVRDEQARLTRIVAENTFEKVAREWHRTMLNQWQPQTTKATHLIALTSTLRLLAKRWLMLRRVSVIDS
jgi:hypothetical protein